MIEFGAILEDFVWQQQPENKIKKQKNKIDRIRKCYLNICLNKYKL